jgi:hypothetical protein
MLFSKLQGFKIAVVAISLTTLLMPTISDAAVADLFKGFGKGGSPKCVDAAEQVLSSGAPKTALEVAGSGSAGGGRSVFGNSRFRGLVNNISTKPADQPFALFRDKEISELTYALQQSASSPPIFTHKVIVLKGDDGVGRSSVMLEIGRRAGLNKQGAWEGAAETSFKYWKDREVLALNLSADSPEVILGLLEGTPDKPGILARAKKSGSVIFIDDLGPLLTAEDAKIIDPSLEKIKKLIFSGEAPVVVESTSPQYLRLETQMRDMARRLHAVDIPELAGAELFQTLQSSLKAGEGYYGVHFTEDAIQRGIEAGKTFNFGKTRIAAPGSVLELCQRVAVFIRHNMKGNSVPVIDGAVFGKALEEISKGGYKQVDIPMLQRLEPEVLKKVKGQDGPVRQFLKGVKTALLRARDGSEWRLEQAMGVGRSFMFLGPSGTGKTYLTKVLKKTLGFADANYKFYDPALLFADHTIAEFVGSPKGYKGMDTGGNFVNWIRSTRGPKIVVFDEWEKVHPTVRQSLLSALQEGKFADLDGNVGYLNDVIFVFTSNVGAETIVKMHGNGVAPEVIHNVVEQAAVDRFSREFVNRTTRIHFNPLGRDQFAGMIGNVMEDMHKVMQKFDMGNVEFSASAQQEIVNLADPAFGGRDLVSTFQNHISDELANFYIDARPDMKQLAEVKQMLGGIGGKSDDVEKIVVAFEDGHFVFQAQMKDGTAIYRKTEVKVINPADLPQIGPDGMPIPKKAVVAPGEEAGAAASGDFEI